MTERVEDTIEIKIYIAGDYREAKRICREFCFENGFCVSVYEADYIYTGGEESGIIVNCINYPRFKSTYGELYQKARALADMLMTGLYQHSYTLSGARGTIWVSRRAENG